jgi:hypothetical protein
VSAVQERTSVHACAIYVAAALAHIHHGIMRQTLPGLDTESAGIQLRLGAPASAESLVSSRIFFRLS